MVADGQYDKYRRKLVMKHDSPHLEDGKLYLPVPSDNYYHVQANIIYLLSVGLFEGNLDDATTHFIQLHSERFAREWNEHPDHHGSMLEYYCRDYVPELDFEKLWRKFGNL